jgi:hypothetical protein
MPTSSSLNYSDTELLHLTSHVWQKYLYPSMKGPRRFSVHNKLMWEGKMYLMVAESCVGTTQPFRRVEGVELARRNTKLALVRF